MWCRIYVGAHFPLAIHDGLTLGDKVAEYVFTNLDSTVGWSSVTNSQSGDHFQLPSYLFVIMDSDTNKWNAVKSACNLNGCTIVQPCRHVQSSKEYFFL